jgi:hypothetical protein
MMLFLSIVAVWPLSTISIGPPRRSLLINATSIEVADAPAFASSTR